MRYLFLVLLASFGLSSFSIEEELCLTNEENALYEMLMTYRKQKNLPPIPLSYSLCKVAKLHVYDLANNNPVNSKCNLHSWSKSGNWSACCYTDDHKEAECMWNKPREISNYTGSGFEIAAFVTPKDKAAAAINGWKKSTGHNQVMINQGAWKNMKWKAVGLGIEGDYVVIWFGLEEDPDKTPTLSCQ